MKMSCASETKTILLVDDNDDLRFLTKLFLHQFGYVVDSARTAEEALAVFDPKTHDLVMTDNGMPAMSGAELAHVIKLRSPATPIIMYTGVPPSDISSVDLIIRRPAHMLLLKESVERLLSAA